MAPMKLPSGFVVGNGKGQGKTTSDRAISWPVFSGGPEEHTGRQGVSGPSVLRTQVGGPDMGKRMNDLKQKRDETEQKKITAPLWNTAYVEIPFVKRAKVNARSFDSLIPAAKSTKTVVKSGRGN